MASGSPDLVDCMRLAEEAAILERVYDLRDLPRLKDVLAEPSGALHARFAFSKTASGRPGAKIEIRAQPHLECQRCLQSFVLPVAGGSEVEFVPDEDAAPCEGARELFRAGGGRVSLRELAEEELLLSLPIAPACDAPHGCGNAADAGSDDGALEDADSMAMRRPFSALKDLLKKT